MDKKQKEQKLFKDIVIRIAQESHCLSKQVAAIAVKDGRIISTGINGTPSGYLNCNDYFKPLYEKNKELLKIKNIHSFQEWIKSEEWRALHHEWSNIHECHAEQNLIVISSRNGICLENVDIYISHEPCINCTKLLAALKPKNIYYAHKYDKSSKLSHDLLHSININLEQI